MNATTWNNRSVWQAESKADAVKGKDKLPDLERQGKPSHPNHDHKLEVVEEEDRTYVISHAGLLQKHSGLGDVLRNVSRGVLIIPIVLLALAVPVVLSIWAGASYLLIFLCLAHLVLISTVLAVWAIAVGYLDMKRGEEALEARPMTAGDGDPSMGSRTLPAKNRYPNESEKSDRERTSPMNRS